MKALHKSNCSSLKQMQIILKAVHQKQIESQQEIYKSVGIGKHLRHIVDHYLALISGLDSGLVNYNHRNRDSEIEGNLFLASEKIADVILWLSNLEEENKSLDVFSEIDCDEFINQKFESNRDRELLYLINHTIHHAAFAKLMLKNLDVELPDKIGIAPCTASHIREEQLENELI